MADIRRHGGEQLPLVLPHEVAFGRDDFLLGASNRAAFSLVEGWPAWPSQTAVIAGPVGSGKTHLAHVWQGVSGAPILAAGALRGEDVTALAANRAVAIEDAHAGFDETALFHLFNAVRDSGASLLVTSRSWPQSWGLRLPDLASRLRAATPVEILEPDDDLLRRVLVKLFADRQIDIDPAVVEFLVVRMERSVAAAQILVEQLDQASLSAARRITRPMAAKVLASAG
ncbi:DnaA/Hda family protein [Stappia sp. MMSF_3263]|uniref:HdaA/DnaA family protein n=1 Tax=Stappia sp. MMSF_3263 TaxID=3046693 RepID=UPI00273F115C|nr:DnaA/Hda family protein [Stappia sp. MMSF_3263]